MTITEKPIITRAELAVLTGMTYDWLRRREREIGLDRCRVLTGTASAVYATRRVVKLAWWQSIFPSPSVMRQDTP